MSELCSSSCMVLSVSFLSMKRRNIRSKKEKSNFTTSVKLNHLLPMFQPGAGTVFKLLLSLSASAIQSCPMWQQGQRVMLRSERASSKTAPVT